MIIQQDFIKNEILWLEKKKYNHYELAKDIIKLSSKTKFIFILYVLSQLFLIFFVTIVQDKMRLFIDNYIKANNKKKLELLLLASTFVILDIIVTIINIYVINYIFYKEYSRIMNKTILYMMSKVNISDVIEINKYKTYDSKNVINQSLDLINNIVSIIVLLCQIIFMIYTFNDLFNWPRILLIVFLIIILGSIIFIGFYIYHKKYIIKQRDKNKEVEKCEDNLLNNYDTIKLYNKFDLFKNKILKLFKSFDKIQHNNQLILILINSIITCCIGIFYFIIMILTPTRSWLINDFNKLTRTINCIGQILQNGGNIMSNISDQSNNFEKLNALIQAYYKPQPNKCLNSDIETIEVKDLNYEIDKHKILSNINVKFNKGDKVLFFGPSGCGKSTLMKLIMGYLKNKSGEILINNININTLNHTNYLNHVTLIEQGNSILDDTVFNNLSMYEADKDKVQEICKKVNFNVDLSRKALGALSGGEQRRVCLLRALLMYKSNNLLLSDEAFANLNKLNITNNIQLINEYITKDSIMIFIEHSLELLPYIDKICVFLLQEDNSYTAQLMTKQEFQKYIQSQII